MEGQTDKKNKKNMETRTNMNTVFMIQTAAA
jgi:hypothetical protein